ncbi:hypothetical protein [Thalassospira lucentensis]|uniref:hypothetical protein n=1 Tax=Thalassospira lucentensis TaxID=168935 RepID=UPI0003B51A5F|nr:hypothetical protein [Thalassospira lucentensis]RCK27728.1 hypothetical protein TH1_10630 [Thalassospira lucentensis MCCC 1A00383 = DSM 14000]
MKFDISIWGEALEVIRRNLVVFLVAIGTLWLVDITIFAIKPEAQSPAYLSFIVGMYLAIACHATILRNVQGFKVFNSLEKKAYTRFWLRAGAIALLSFIPTFVLSIAIFQSLDLKAAGGDVGFILAMLIGVILYGGLSLALLSLAGTWLPAAIMGDGSSLKRAFARGRKTVGYSASRLIIGPGANVVLFAISIFVLPPQIPEAIRAYTFHVGSFQFIPLDIVLNGFGNVVWATGTVLIAVVLSRAYLLGEERCKNNDVTGQEQIPELQRAD